LLILKNFKYAYGGVFFVDTVYIPSVTVT